MRAENDKIYSAPKTRVGTRDDRVIELLCRFKYQLKVINMLRQEGASYENAKNLVMRNVRAAQAELNKKNRLWMLMGFLFLLPVVCILGSMIWYSYMGFVPIILMAIFAAVSMKFFQLRETIKF